MKLIKWSTTFDAFSKEMCPNIDKEFQDWFKEPKQIANEVGADIKVPRSVLSSPTTPSKCTNRHPITILQAQCWHTFLGSYRPRNEFKVLWGKPVRSWSFPVSHGPVCCTCKCSDLYSMNNKLQFWKDNIPIRLSLVNEIKEWKRHWTGPYSNHKKTWLRCWSATWMLMRESEVVMSLSNESMSHESMSQIWKNKSLGRNNKI